MSKNLTRGVMSTEESTLLTLLSSLCARASLKGEMNKMCARASLKGGISCFDLTWPIRGLKSLKGRMNKDVCQISCLNLTWKVRGLQQEISSWNWNMQCEEIIVKAIIEYFSNGQQPTYCMMSHCPRQSCPLKPSCPSRWLSPFSWPWQPVQTVGQPKSTPSSCVTPKHPLLSNPRRKAVFLRVTFLFQEINAISFFLPFFVTPFLLLFLPI